MSKYLFPAVFLLFSNEVVSLAVLVIMAIMFGFDFLGAVERSRQ